jgi:hypothetical protein
LDSTLAAGLIQGAATFIPAAALAGAAFVGLNSWQKQIRGARAVDRAEACLVATHEVVDLIRACRGSVITYTEEETATPERMREAGGKMRAESLDRAWASWRNFAAEYRRAGFFLTLPAKDAAEEIAGVLTELTGLARIIAHLEPMDDASGRQELAEYRASFLGNTRGKPRDPNDPLEVRLQAALSSVEKSLLPITGSRRR